MFWLVFKEQFYGVNLMAGLNLSKQNLELSQIFIELRFRDNFKIEEKRYKLLDRLTEYLSEYRRDSPNDEVHCRDPQKNILVSVLLNRMVVDAERLPASPASFNEFEKVAVRAIKDISEILKIDNFLRVGVRSYWDYNVESLQAAVDLIVNNYLAFKEGDWREIGARPQAGHIILNFSFGSVKANLIVLPQKMVIIESGLVQQTKTHEKNFIRIDWDYFMDVPMTPNAVPKFLEEAYLSLGKRVLPFLNRRD